jgi:asparaginyl-tRNA synthetase
VSLNDIQINSILHQIIKSYDNWFTNKGFVRKYLPNILDILGSCENIDESFSIVSPNKCCYLTQTSQILLEMLLQSEKAVWCLSKSFRNEKYEDARHLREFNMIEFEGAFPFDELIKHIEDIYKHVLNHILSNTKLITNLSINEKYIENQVLRPIDIIEYDECLKILGNKCSNFRNIDNLDEKALLYHVSNNKTPFFIIEHNIKDKFFNMASKENSEGKVLSVDLILPYSGESAGGAQREVDILLLKKRFSDNVMSKYPSEFKYYFDLISSNKLPCHSGCGFGIERIIQSILREDDIRKCSIDCIIKNRFQINTIF